MKIAAVHVINPVRIMWPMYSLLMKLLKKKLRDRIHVHYSLEDFHRHIELSILPASYGGKLKEAEAFDLELVNKIMNDNLEYKRSSVLHSVLY